MLEKIPHLFITIVSAMLVASTFNVQLSSADEVGSDAEEEEITLFGDLEALSIVAAEVEWQRNNEKAKEKGPVRPETGAGIQATFNTQHGVGAAALASAENPEISPVAEGDIVAVLKEEVQGTVLGAATSAQSGAVEGFVENAPEGEFIAAAASLQVIDGDITEGEVIEPQSVDVITATTLDHVPSVVAEVEAELPSEFSFALTGKQVPAKKTQATSEVFSASDESVETTLTPILDHETGVMNIAGECSDVWYVVLLYKKERDYARDPRSHILNQAFPCKDGQFSYMVSELPSTLPSGTYYLLIGQQGDRGGWTPITALTEVTINSRN